MRNTLGRPAEREYRVALDSSQCAECGHVFDEPAADVASTSRQPCPKCGSTARKFAASFITTVTSSVSMNMEVQRSPQLLLSTAESLVESQHFGVAVVVSHIACEVAVERCLLAAFAARGDDPLRDPVLEMLNGYGLSNSRNRSVYVALTGDKIADQLFWPRYQESVKRRNKFVHRGIDPSKREAIASVTAAKELIEHVGLH